MTEKSPVIILLSRRHLAAWGIDPGDLARKIEDLEGAAEVRLVEGLSLEQIEAARPGARLILVGRTEPGPWTEVDLAAQMPWLAGSQSAKALALIEAALTETHLARETTRQTITPSRRVLVWGEGPAARQASSELVRAGFEVLPCPGLSDLEGFAGRFTAFLSKDGLEKEVQAGALVLCGSGKRELAYPDPHLETGLTTLTALEAKREKKWTRDSRLVFLTGLGRAPTPAGMRRIMSLTLALRTETRAAVYVLSPEVQVAGPGLERLYSKARQAGIVFIRTPAGGPEMKRLADGRIRLTVYDPLARGRLTLTPDLVVLEDVLGPDEDLARLMPALGLMGGVDGFLSPDNVLFLSEATNRAGVLAMGPARGTDSPEALALEIGAAVEKLERLLSPAEIEIDRLAVDKGRCTICLTCVRACPHQALGFTNRPWPDPKSCAECGLCAAECPMDALQLEGYTGAQVKARLEALLARPRIQGEFLPRLVLFGCRRSAGPALAAAPRPETPVDLACVPLPCAGRIEDDLILTAFLGGADGVLVAACHEDNCRTHRGGPEARRRLEHARDLLAEAGLDPKRLGFITLAPNEGAEFARDAAEFNELVKKLGPNGYKDAP